MYISVAEASAQSPNVYSNLLYSTMSNGSINFTFMPTQPSVELSMNLFYISIPNAPLPYMSFTLDSVSYTQETGTGGSIQLVQVSNKVKGGYRFGYNGQEKVDEIAGAGNHNTAEFWEYDTRLGRRWNVDPVKKPSLSDYSTFSGNPIWKVDPNGDDDYKIDKKGHISLTKKTGAKNHSIFNADGSKSTIVGLYFFKQKFEGSSGRGKDKKENTIIVGRNLKDMENAYKFFADNSDVEWQYNIYENKGKLGSLASSHTDGLIENQAELSYRLLGKNADAKLLYSSHSHPGTYDSKTGWPAYPSGFTYQLKPDLANPGDRDNYKYYKDNFAGRIPSMFNIYIVGKPMLEVEYNDKVVNRVMALPAITITPNIKKK